MYRSVNICSRLHYSTNDAGEVGGIHMVGLTFRVSRWYLGLLRVTLWSHHAAKRSRTHWRNIFDTRDKRQVQYSISHKCCHYD